MYYGAKIGAVDPTLVSALAPPVISRMNEAYTKDVALLMSGLALAHKLAGGPPGSGAGSPFLPAALGDAVVQFLGAKLPTQRVPPENINK